MTFTCDHQLTGVVTMAMEVLYNGYNVCSCDLPDMLLCSRPSGLRYKAIYY